MQSGVTGLLLHKCRWSLRLLMKEHDHVTRVLSIYFIYRLVSIFKLRWLVVSLPFGYFNYCFFCFVLIADSKVQMYDSSFLLGSDLMYELMKTSALWSVMLHSFSGLHKSLWVSSFILLDGHQSIFFFLNIKPYGGGFVCFRGLYQRSCWRKVQGVSARRLKTPARQVQGAVVQLRVPGSAVLLSKPRCLTLMCQV